MEKVAQVGLKRVKWTILAALAAILAGLAPVATAAPPSAEPAESRASPRPDGGTTPRPAIWLLADADTRIYLFGTIHILPPDLRWRSPEFDRIVAESDELVMEIGEDPAEADGAALFAPMLLGKQVPILARVSPEKREPLRRIIESSGMPIETFDSMQTWAAALVLSIAAITQAYADEGIAPGARSPASSR
ncbi:MAG: TraB/GumN family protein [Allosphingosinicella sp.]